jgi:hypothetical protein
LPDNSNRCRELFLSEIYVTKKKDRAENEAQWNVPTLKAQKFETGKKTQDIRL